MQPLSTVTKRLLTNYILLSESAVNSEGLLCLKAHANKYFAFVKMHAHSKRRKTKTNTQMHICTFSPMVLYGHIFRRFAAQKKQNKVVGSLKKKEKSYYHFNNDP